MAGSQWPWDQWVQSIVATTVTKKSPLGFYSPCSGHKSQLFLGWYKYNMRIRIGSRGPRPNSWKVQGEIPHQQHIAWHRMRAQAAYRGEDWDLTFEQFQEIWSTHWHQRGRGSDDYCLTRTDYTQPWSPDNIEVLPRRLQLRRRSEFIKRNKDDGLNKWHWSMA